MIDVLMNLDLSKYPVSNLPDFKPDKCIHIRKDICFGRMPQGTVEGKSTVMIIAKLPNGEHVVIENSLANFAAAADIFRACDRDAEKKSTEAKN